MLADESIGAFDVEILHNEPEYKVRRRISQFFADRNRDDLLLVHFSCHGLKDDDGTLYFATPDTEIEHLDSTAVPSDFVNRQMQRSRSRRIALFLDCCYSGAFSRGAMARASDGVQLAERFDGQGQVVITASNAMEYAFEGDELTGAGTPSVFTTAIVEGLSRARRTATGTTSSRSTSSTSTSTTASATRRPARRRASGPTTSRAALRREEPEAAADHAGRPAGRATAGAREPAHRRPARRRQRARAHHGRHERAPGVCGPRGPRRDERGRQPLRLDSRR